jgi:hypothetical protein
MALRQHTDLMSAHSNPSLPEGYVTIKGTADQTYIVPEFMVPSLSQELEGHRKKQELEAFSATGSVSRFGPYHLSVVHPVAGSVHDRRCATDRHVHASRSIRLSGTSMDLAFCQSMTGIIPVISN